MPDCDRTARRRTPAAAGFRRLGRLASLGLAAYLGVLLVLLFAENALIFFPSVYPEGIWHLPGLSPEDAWFEAPDGTRLHGWYFSHPQARAAVLFCHGNGGNITHRAEIVERLRRTAQVSVLVFDYRGYGRSDGKPSEAGILADARAARAWLAAREGIAQDQVVLMGESIGGAVAVDLAVDGARGLILENTFSSLPEVAARHFRWLPVRWLMRTRLDSHSKIGRYHGPLLQSHGDPDSIVPYDLGLRLFEAAHEPKQFITYPGHDHNDPRPQEWYEAIARFIRDLGPGA